ncbi:MAG: thermonuclease family protein [Planctomycetota bacterium]|nr:thermonuclease family protein [Planctomycetota bacterium]
MSRLGVRSRLRRRVGLFVLVIALAVLSALDHAGVFGYRGGDRMRYDGAIATVTRVVDGDTLDVDLPDGHRAVTRIRLRGIDCPEIAHGPDGQDDPYGPEAAESALILVLDKRVRIALDPMRKTRDRYGRLLAYVYLADTDESLNERLLEEGLARANRRFPHVFSFRYGNIEKRAKRNGEGFWGDRSVKAMPSSRP